MILAGLAGVGKSRLARVAADAAAKTGWVVRRVAGTATGRQVTLGAFARWVDDADMSPSVLARKVLVELTSGTGTAPLLVVVDDAHLLDDLSALVLHQLVLQDMADVIVTIRTGQAAPDAVTALWKDGLLRRLELQPLSRNECDQLLQAVLGGPLAVGCAEWMWRLSRGNVLFLNHLVAQERESGRLTMVDGEWRWAGTPSVSPSLVELVEQQIGVVPDDVREIVDLVAIAEPVSRELLMTLAEPRSIEEAEERELIGEAATGDAVYVGHPLYSEIRLSRCGPMRLRRLRGRVATAMAQADASDPLRLGLLWLESDLAPDADVLSRAATVAATRHDPRLAERLCRAAIAVKPSPAANLLLAHVLFLQERGEEAQAILDSLESDESAAPGFLDGVILRAAVLMWPLQKADEAMAVIAEAISSGDDDRNHSLRTFRAIGHVMAAEPGEAIKAMATVDYNKLDDVGRVVGHTLETIAHGELGCAQEATKSASAGYRVQAESPHDAIHGTGLAEFHADALLAAGYVDEAVAVAEREYRRCTNFPGMPQWMALAALGSTAIGKGDLSAALRYFRSATEGFGGTGDTGGVLYRIRIPQLVALARSGDVGAAVAASQAIALSRHPTWKYLEPSYLLATAWVSAALGRVSEASDAASSAATFARSRGQSAREVLCLQTAAQFGDTEGADRLAELATMVEGPRAPLSARYARALAVTDATGLDAASRDFEAMGDVLAAVDAAAQAASLHRRAGRSGSALTSSGRAQLLAKQCGGAVSPALAAARLPLPFTRREHEITRLLSHGLSNKDIAEALSLSVRTVEGHVYQASTKVGISSRAELAALVRAYDELETQ
ncbi:helix-turn-helix transcriptional regulator [Mycolicibacterium sphagni]|nr:LuxR C-terminal-related transcriptional regulator [Mycolicibacterium sphagni]